MKKIIYFLIIMLSLACSEKRKEINKDLIYFNSEFLAELGDENYEKYESDSNIAKSIDEACLSCPVIKMCYDSGVENEEYGVWGGVYLNAGSINRSRNTHKDQDTWKRLKKKNVY